MPPNFGEPGWLGHYYNTGDGEFEIDITRQFVWQKRGQHQAMSRLKCPVYFTAREELGAVGGAVMWSFDEQEERFFRDTLASDGFSITGALELRPRRVEIKHEDLWDVTQLASDRWGWSAWTGSNRYGPRSGARSTEAEARRAVLEALKSISEEDLAARMYRRPRPRSRRPD